MIPVLLLALALAMDATAVAIGEGAGAGRHAALPLALRVGAAFGLAQGVMPVLGWLLGQAFASAIGAVDHWVAFGLLTLLGARMIRGTLTGGAPAASMPAGHGSISGSVTAAPDGGTAAPPMTGWPLLAAAVATSIDAAAAGVTIALFEQPLLLVCATIGAVTFILSASGVLIGRALGAAVGRSAGLFGGLMLIGLGSHILYEHLGR